MAFGVCSVCQWSFSLTAKGAIRSHGPTYNRCQGSGHSPRRSDRNIATVSPRRSDRNIATDSPRRFHHNIAAVSPSQGVSSPPPAHALSQSEFFSLKSTANVRIIE